MRQMFEEISPWLEPGEGQVLYGPKGCPKCRMQGYSGRTGVFEVLPVSPGIREQILERQPTQVLRRKAIEQGMIEFRRSALLEGRARRDQHRGTLPRHAVGRPWRGVSGGPWTGRRGRRHRPRPDRPRGPVPGSRWPRRIGPHDTGRRLSRHPHFYFYSHYASR